MELPSIDPNAVYQIRKTFALYSKPKSELSWKEDTRKSNWREELKLEIKQIVEYAFNASEGNSGLVFQNLSKDSFESNDIIETNIDVLQQALSIYERDRQEATYVTLLSKPVAEMNGYEYSLLMNRILNQSKN